MPPTTKPRVGGRGSVRPAGRITSSFVNLPWHARTDGPPKAESNAKRRRVRLPLDTGHGDSQRVHGRPKARPDQERMRSRTVTASSGQKSSTIPPLPRRKPYGRCCGGTTGQPSAARSVCTPGVGSWLSWAKATDGRDSRPDSSRTWKRPALGCDLMEPQSLSSDFPNDPGCCGPYLPAPSPQGRRSYATVSKRRDRHRRCDWHVSGRLGPG